MNRVLGSPLDVDDYLKLRGNISYIGVTDGFRKVIEYFKAPEDETSAGFRIEYSVEDGNVLKVDLVRDISYDKNSIKRPTNILFSADSADSYEVESIKDLIVNLTCNPGIIYDLFINNPRANVNNRFKTRDEVMQEIEKILGAGVDIIVERNDPFNSSEQQILEEAARFREMLSKYRVVIKVPHTGPVNAQNVSELLSGDKKFHRRYNEGATRDMMRGHNLALLPREH